MSQQTNVSVIVQRRGCCAGCASTILLSAGAILLFVDIRTWIARNEGLFLVGVTVLVLGLAAVALTLERRKRR